MIRRLINNHDSPSVHMLLFTVYLYIIFHGKITTLCSSLAGLDFDAVLLKPKEMSEGSKLPLIVMPHGLFFSAVCILQYKNDATNTLRVTLTSCFAGLLSVCLSGGPHSVLVTEWILSTAVLCKMGFSVLLGEKRL